jgi:putative AlgH/UPF0301 family transcriptional regulator
MANNFKSYGLNNNTANTILYTVPNATQTTAIGLVVANKTSGTVTANVIITRANTTYNIIQQAPILTGSSLVVIGGDQKVVLMANDSVSISSSANTDAWISVLEIS